MACPPARVVAMALSLRRGSAQAVPCVCEADTHIVRAGGGPSRLPPPSAPSTTRAAPGGPSLFTLPGFTDIEGPPGEFLPMQRGNRSLRCCVVRHLDKAKAAWAPCLPVGNEVDAIHHSIRREQFAHVLFCHGEREIAHKNLHWMSLLGFCHPWPPQDCEEKRCHRPCSSATRCSEAAGSPYSSRNVPLTLRESRERWGGRDSCVTADALCPLEETIVLHVTSSTLTARRAGTASKHRH